MWSSRSSIVSNKFENIENIWTGRSYDIQMMAKYDVTTSP